MGLLEYCQKFFNTTNLYEVLGITEQASEKEVKKAYHKLSLQVHPDRVTEDEKLEATEKFKVLGNIHAILSDKEKRAIYDETKCVDDDEFNAAQDRDWSFYWRNLFKPITEEDIRAYEQEYAGSAEEEKDLKNAYLAGKGDMDYICDHVQFARSDQEDRLREILNRLIEAGELPSFRIFKNEPLRKKQRRHNKEKKEAQEAEKQRKLLGLDTSSASLKLMIRNNQQERKEIMDDFLNDLAMKYANEKPKNQKKKNTTTPAGPAAKNRKKN